VGGGGRAHMGVPRAAVLAEAGFWVTGYDTNDDFIVRVNTTRTVDFQEEGLAALLERNLHNRLTLTSTRPSGQDIYIITVGTPLEAGTEQPDLDKIRLAVQRLAPGLRGGPAAGPRSTGRTR